MDMANGSNKENLSSKVKVKQISERLKLEIKPKDKKSKAADQ